LASIRTLNDLYFHSAERHAATPAFRTRTGGAYRDVSRAEFTGAGTEVSLGLIAHGLEQGDRVVILSENRLEWALADFGILTAALIGVPIHCTLTASGVDHIVENSGAKAAFASTPAQAAKLDGIRSRRPGFPVFVMERAEEVAGAESLDALRERGRALGRAEPGLHRGRAGRVAPEDTATIIYTSGTTGVPKGVMLTHANIMSNVNGGLQVFDLTEKDVALSFLPLSHIMERTAGFYTMLCAGATIAFAESVDTVAANMLEVRPTVMITVPRFFEKIYTRVLDAAMSGGIIRRRMFRWARRAGTEYSGRKLAGEPVPAGLRVQAALADRLVFRKLRARTGGRVRFFVSGGAPLSRDIAEFFHAAGLVILEGYGLTETSPVLAVNTFDHLKLGTVGRPFPGIELRIADDGEILARGPGVMQGYYHDPEGTAEAIRDGWFHTGDVGRIDEEGFLLITDRKKDIIVTAGGKNVAPQPLENRLRTDPYIQEAVVFGDRKPFLVALVVPNFAKLEEHARLLGLNLPDRGALTASPEMREFLMARVERHQGDRASVEQVKKIHVLDHELSQVEGELTPKLNVRRRRVAERYRTEIEAMYGLESEER